MSAAAFPRRQMRLLAVWGLLPPLTTGYQIASKSLANQLYGTGFSLEWLLGHGVWPMVFLLLFCEAVSFVLWMYILARMSLSEAFPLSALGYVLIIAASYFVFGEPITPAQLLGSGAILAGACLVGGTPAEVRRSTRRRS